MSGATFAGGHPTPSLSSLKPRPADPPSHDSFQKCQIMSPPKNQRFRAVPLSKAATSGDR
jgi:hypothetical protein